MPNVSRVPFDRRPGEVLSCDFSRTFAVPDLDGYTCFVIFTDSATQFTFLYRLRSHHEFYDAAADVLRRVRAELGVGVKHIFGDSDVISPRRQDRWAIVRFRR